MRLCVAGNGSSVRWKILIKSIVHDIIKSKMSNK